MGEDVWLGTTDVENIDFSELMRDMTKKCDSFVLVVPFVPYDMGSECYSLTPDESAEILKRTYDLSMEESRILWERIPEAKRKELPPYDEFISQIEDERKRILSTSETMEDILQQSQSSSKEAWETPELWHIYYKQDFQSHLEFIHRSFLESDKRRDIVSELRTSENKALLMNLIDSKLSHSWHCTTSSQLMIIHTFRCNDDTSEWLGRNEDIYHIKGFEDLAFFKDGECVMSVCAHERMASLKVI